MLFLKAPCGEQATKKPHQIIPVRLVFVKSVGLLGKELVRDLPTERGQPGRGRVFGAAFIQRFFGGVDDVLRGVEVGLAGAEADDRFALRLHRLRFGGDRESQGGRDGRNSLRDIHTCTSYNE